MLSQAIILLHEVGHAAAFNGLPSVVQSDLIAPDMRIQNQLAVGDACFPQGNFGGNQGPLGSGAVPIPAIRPARQF
jgi:hypothetical protein